jgi:beta-glucanase (GH16 family)
LDSAKWNNVFDARGYNGELQLYTPANVWVEDGHLRIESRRESISYQGQQYAYTSGRVDTNGKFSQMYGRFEVRARLPMTRGVWPAHWLLPATSWPPEIDIMELLGHDPTTVYLSNHWGTPADHGLLMLHYTGPNFAADFHTFVVEWEPSTIRWLVDGVVRASTTDHIPAVPMYLILNTAIGGTFPAYPDASTVLPQVHDIDYVRVYRRA